MAQQPEHDERGSRVGDLISQVNATTRAPDSLRASVEALRADAVRRPGLVMRLRLGFAGLASAAAVAAALVIGLGGTTAAPALAQVVAIAGRAPTGSAPAPDTKLPGSLLSAQVGGLHFPDWAEYNGWRASGQRTDTISGRRIVTVYYTRGATRLVYSIVASPALVWTGRDVYKIYRSGARVTVVWTDAGHTCVLTAAGVKPELLWRLAETTAEGTTPAATTRTTPGTTTGPA